MREIHQPLAISHGAVSHYGVSPRPEPDVTLGADRQIKMRAAGAPCGPVEPFPALHAHQSRGPLALSPLPANPPGALRGWMRLVRHPTAQSLQGYILFRRFIISSCQSSASPAWKQKKSPEKKLQRACCSLTMLDPSAGLHLLRRYSHLPPWPWASDVGAVHGQMDTTTEAVR